MNATSATASATSIVATPSIDQYCNLDFSVTGPLASDLNAFVSVEAEIAARNREVHVTDVLDGSNPAYLTPKMVEWYQRYVYGPRRQALGEINAMLGNSELSGVGLNSIEEIERERSRRKLLASKRDIVRDQRTKRRNDMDRLDERRVEHKEQSQLYRDKKQSLGNREPRIVNPVVYGITLVVILFLEGLVNFETFMSLSWATPAIATGATILIGLCIGAAAHYHGTFFRQWGYWFGDHQDDARRWPAFRMLALGVFTLSVALSFVWYARSTYLAAQLILDEQLGRESSSGFWLIGGSLLGNVLVYIAGVFVAYFVHDEDPEFPALKKTLGRIDQAIVNLENSLQDERNRGYEKAEAIYRKEISSIENKARSASRNPTYLKVQSQIERFKAQDGAVRASLLAYRGLLSSRHELDVVEVVGHSEKNPGEVERLTWKEYMGRELSLPYVI